MSKKVASISSIDRLLIKAARESCAAVLHGICPQI